ncbi:hypothetical protein, partial [Escherichia coli]|uniref:hypothetical protein n=1 Tax=Escherichia coli TaxID=562 RepID=UPI001C52B59D
TDGDGSHGSTSKTPSYTKSVSWHHYQNGRYQKMNRPAILKKESSQRCCFSIKNNIFILFVPHS